MVTSHNHIAGLDFVRTYASVSVLVYHIAMTLLERDVPANWIRIPFLNGVDGVTLFFVLSGFLITYRLLDEKKRTRTISIKGFYIRRALRIFPLYYLVLFICLVVIPVLFPASDRLPPTDLMSVLLSVFWMPNVAYALMWHHVAGHFWSLGVEEQFYALYAPLMKWVGSVVMIAVILIAIRWVIYSAATAGGNQFLIAVAAQLRLDCMAMGVIGAWIIQERGLLLRLIHHPAMQLFGLSLFVYCIVMNFSANEFENTLKAFGFMIYIVNVASNPKAWLRIETSWTRIGADLSYATYMIHPVILVVLTGLLSPVTPEDAPVIVIGTFVLTGLLSWLSYRYYERPILALKNRKNAKLTAALSSTTT